MSELIHVWHRCHGCDAAPIVGTRYECAVCPAGPDNDLCAACHARFRAGQLEHPLTRGREAVAGTHTFRAINGAPRADAAPWLAVRGVAAAPPAVPDRSVVRPEFRSGVDSYLGSYAFVVAPEDGGRALLLTALHVLDELIRARRIDATPANAAYTGRELPPRVSEVQLYDVFAANWITAELGLAGEMLVLPRARIPATEPFSDTDIAAFRVRANASVQTLRLAAAPPVAGEPVWLVANRGRAASARTTPAVVVEATERTLIFRLAPGTAMPPYGSGAPLLNTAGEAVGILSGGGMLDGQQFGHACHAGNIRRHLGWT
jgi:hypothetical protein